MSCKVISLLFPHEYKARSLEDQLYFTLTDIYHNCDMYQHCMRAKHYYERLTGDICYEERGHAFQYQPVLQQMEYVDSLWKWMQKLEPKHFGLNDKEQAEAFDLPFQEWWTSFESLRQAIQQRKEELILQTSPHA